jgi:hypothetical protein
MTNEYYILVDLHHNWKIFQDRDHIVINILTENAARGAEAKKINCEAHILCSKILSSPGATKRKNIWNTQIWCQIMSFVAFYSFVTMKINIYMCVCTFIHAYWHITIPAFVSSNWGKEKESNLEDFYTVFCIPSTRGMEIRTAKRPDNRKCLIHWSGYNSL